MSEKKVEAGGLVYREGDSAEFAYIVISGEVELLEMRDGREVQVDTVGPGKVFGELAAFDPMALRPQSARAIKASTLKGMSYDEFKAQFLQCPDGIRPILELACEKMKAVRSKKKVSLADAVLESDIGTITIAPGGENLNGAFNPFDIPVTRLPFRIGGYPEGSEISRRDQVHLSIASPSNPLKISRQHCEIAVENKSIVVVDLGSRFCTQVNEQIIGRGRGNYSAPLRKGTNEIVLSPMDASSQGGAYKLTVTCA